MPHSRRTFAILFAAAAIMSHAGCAMHSSTMGTSSATGDDGACTDGRSARCRHGFHLFDHLHTEAAPEQTGGQPPLTAPISNFFPVPTRPVFTPWVETPPAEEISGPLAWKRSADQHGADGLAKDAGEPDGIPIARRILPPPAILPEDRRPPNRSPSSYYDSSDDRAAQGPSRY
jgi:hypothetical protein